MKLDNHIYFVGMGGLGLEVLDAIAMCGHIELIRGIYDIKPVNLKCYKEIPFLGSVEDFKLNKENQYFFCPIGHDRIRKSCVEELENAGKIPISVIHDDANVSSHSNISEGVYIGSGCFVGPNVQVGKGSIVNVNSSIGHDSILGEYCHISPGARVSGECVLGEGAFLGSNAVISQKTSVSNWAKLGANSFANRKMLSNHLYVGNPAKKVIF